MLTTPPELVAAMSRIERLGRDEFADSYAGLEVDQAQGLAIVFRVPSAAFDDAARRAAEDARVIIRDAAHSAAELSDWHERVDLDYWAADGVQIRTVGARHDGTGVEVGVADPAGADRLRERYGSAAPLIIVGQAPVRTFGPGG
jgi:hypothetical protein